jgi:hypothetical protein
LNKHEFIEVVEDSKLSTLFMAEFYVMAFIFSTLVLKSTISLLLICLVVVG